MRELADDPTKAVTADEMTKTLANVRKLSRVVEHEIHETILSCTRARRQMLEMMSVAKPTVH